MENTIDYYLSELCNNATPSGFELNKKSDIVEYLVNNFKDTDGEPLNLEENNFKYFTDKIGNRYLYYYTGADKTVMISAHIDEIGFRVQSITEKGMLTVQNIGGIDIKSAIGQRVRILKPGSGDIIGVIGKEPIHTETQEERKKVCTLDKLLVDIGAKSYEGASAMVSVGTPIVFERNYTTMLNNNVCSCGLDDKAGCAVALKVMENFINNPNMNINLFVVLTTQEEEGLRGARIAAARVNPDISIDFDVTFATDEGRGVSEAKYGKVVLGNGPVLVHGSDKSESLIREMTVLAGDIPYQEICARPGGTNTSAIQLNSYDCETMLISIPNRNMHTPVEVVNLNDLQNTVKLVGKYLEIIGGEFEENINSTDF